MAEIKVIIPNDKVDEFRTAFLRVFPKPDNMTDLEWVTAWTRKQLVDAYRLGKQRLFADTVTITADGIIE